MLRRLPQTRKGKTGKRKIVQVPLLMETFTLDDVASAVWGANWRSAVRPVPTCGYTT